MPATDIWAVVPVKETQRAKQRLAEVIPANRRAGFSLAMLKDVLIALSGARGLAGIVVVTVDKAAAAIARHYGARVVSDGAHLGHTEAVEATARHLMTEGRGGMLQIPGDIPLVTTEEISLLLTRHRCAPSFTIVPAQDDLGSNAVIVSPPTAVPLAFGHDSFFPHLEAARQHDIEPLIVRLPGIGLDIDRPEDLSAFTQARSATHTQEYLNRYGLLRGLRTAHRQLEAKETR
jgi:2-phospho-L-lactate/phosphoenolpyruvate guanylyltransferase